LKVVAYTDLGGLGTKQGPPVTFVWRLPNLLPLLLPWLALLALLALPSNRNPRAWWIWAPLIGVALIGAWLGAAAEAADNEGLGYCIQAASAAALGLGAVWLLGAGLARRCQVVSVVLMVLAFSAVGLAAFVVSPVSEQLWDLRRWEPALIWYLLLFWIVGGVAFAGALNLTGWICRMRFGRLRVSLWLPLWLWVMWLLAGALLGGVVTMVSGHHFEWVGLLLGPAVLALVSFVLVLPFLILSFTCVFYYERLRDLLRLPAESGPPPTPASAPVAVGESPQ
jgi:hypothetical protein